VKEEYEPSAIKVLDGTKVHVTTEGKQYLGAALGSRMFRL